MASLATCQARRIGLIKPSALGDIVQALPVLAALRRRFPDSHITWVVNRSFEPLLHGHPDLDATLPFDRGALGRGWRGLRGVGAFVQALRQQRWDLAIDLQGLFRSALMAWASGAPRRVGLASAREGARWFYTDLIAETEQAALHAVERYWRVAEAFGVGDLPRTFRLPLADEARRWAEQTLAGRPRPWLVLAVGARWQTKRWPVPHFAALAGRAQREFGGTVLLIGTAEERAAAQAVARRLPGPSAMLAGRTSLPQLAALLARADVVLANDTGPLHLAAALGRPVVAPYTCTKVARHGPYGALAGAVESRVWCQGSYRKRCARLECMTELTPDRLWPRLRERLQACPVPSRSA